MLIDVHGHFGQITPGVSPPGRLNTYAGSAAVSYVLVSNRDGAAEPAGAGDRDELDVNVACLEACRANPRLLPLYWLRPGRLDSSVYAFAGALATNPFLGAVFSPSAAGFDAGDAALLDPYLAVLEATGHPALICVGGDDRSSPAKLYELARRHSLVPIILCPCGAPDTVRGEAVEVVRHAVQRNDARLFIDTSHAAAGDIRAAIQMLGASRVLFGTNAAAYADAHGPRHIAILDELRRALSPDDYRQVTGGNALRLFGMDQKDAAVGTRGVKPPPR